MASERKSEDMSLDKGKETIRSSKNLAGAIDFRENNNITNKKYVMFDGGFVYKGIMKSESMGFDATQLKSIIDREGGLTAAFFGLTDMKLTPVAKNPIGNASGITGFHHTSTSLEIATMFAVSTSFGSTSGGNGLVMAIKLGPDIGVNVNDTNAVKDRRQWESEKEISIPGFIYKSEVVAIFDIQKCNVVSKWINADHSEDESTINEIESNIQEYLSTLYAYACRA